MVLKCEHCGTSFSVPSNLNRHINGKVCFRKSVIAQYGVFPCEQCSSSFTRKDNLIRHVERAHQGVHGRVYTCGYCKNVFASYEAVRQHRKEHIAAWYSGTVETGFVCVQSAHNQKCTRFRYVFPDEPYMLDRAIEELFNPLLELLERLVFIQFITYVKNS